MEVTIGWEEGEEDGRKRKRKKMKKSRRGQIESNVPLA